MSRLALPLAVAALGLGLAGCGQDTSESSDVPANPAALEGDITVLAAASLTESFTTVGEQFEHANPGVEVRFSFAASSTLAAQIAGGAPADVFASASSTTMDDAVATGDVADPVVFATNSMEIAVPAANPGNVTGIDDLARPDVMTALCQPQAPCGSTAAELFSHAKLTVTPVTLEPDVKAVLSKVKLGEVDAGVVYVTDVLAAGDEVTGVEIPADVNASTSYPIAALTSSARPDVAAAFVDFVLSPAGTRVLSAAGFAQP
jgi:molybdate transport system substrate-binding protein